MSCPIKRRIMVVSCHQCLGCGYTVRSRDAIDRSANSYNCGEVCRLFAERPKTGSCFLCKEKKEEVVNHITGSVQCRVFNSDLEKVKKALTRSKKK